MSRGSLQGLAAERIYAEKLGGRYVDLAIDLRTDSEDKDCQSLLEVGGRWDKEAGDWCGDAETCVVWHLQAAQYDAARWYADWLAAHITGVNDPAAEAISALFYGGRRGGKSDLGVRALAIFAVAVQGSLCWAISPTQEETDELKQVLDSTLPLSWYQYSESSATYTLWNGTRIRLMSGFKPASLKRGRVDFWLMNEGQRFNRAAYPILAAPLADEGGLGIVTANPPDEPKGRWVMDVHEKGDVAGWRLFEFDNRKNRHTDWTLLEQLRDNPAVSAEEFEREIMGKFIPIGDVVFHAWNARENVRPEPDLGRTTPDFCKKHLGRAFERIAVCDFQILPHMVATIWETYRGPDGTDLLWCVDCVLVEKGDEDDLIDGLEALGLDPATTAVIGDASGEFQEGKRTPGRGSFDHFRKRGWSHLYYPDAKTKKNPDIIATVRVANGLMRNAAGVRRLFVSPDNHYVIGACSKWAMHNGMPKKKSPYAHIGDTIRYFVWRFFPRRAARKRFEYNKVERKRSKRERDLDLI